MKALLGYAPLLVRLRGPLLLTLILSLVTIAAGVGLLGISGWFLTAAALSTAGAAFNIFVPSAGVRGLSFLRILSRYGEKLSGHDATLKLLSDLRVWLFARLFPLVPLRRRLGRGDLVSRLLTDIDALDTLFLLALGPITTAVLVGLGMTAVLAVLLPAAAPTYAIAFLGAVLLVPTGLILASRKAGEEAMAATAKLRQSVLDGIDGHRDLIAFDAAADWSAGANADARALSGARKRLGIRGVVASMLVQLLCGAALVGTLVAGLEALNGQRLEGPLLAGLLLAVMASFEACAMLVRSATRLAGAAAAAERLNAVANAQPAVGTPSHPVEPPPGGNVAFEEVVYGYEGAPSVLKGVSFSVTTGQCVGIAGASGSGKSTIAHLLAGLARPQDGVITLNGCDLSDIDPSRLHQLISLMTQDAPVFLDTIRANLLIGRDSAWDDELWLMLAHVGLVDFVRSLPQGLDTLVGEAGRTLSSGQARRLCLARTLLSNAPVIVLDEPTSGLDQEAEAEFLVDLPRLLSGRTGIVISHAVLPKSFDRVITLRGGTAHAS